MPSGVLGKADLAAATNTSLYTVPTGKLATFNVSLANRNGAAVTVRLALAAAATPLASEWLIYDYTIPANGVIERTGLVADAAKIAVVYASSTGVSAVAYGLED